MPRYRYQCHDCGENFCVFHHWDEKHNLCTECGSEDISKIISKPLRAITKKAEKTGQLTDEYIKANKQILEDLKNESKSENYEPS
jgi:putative FmdB family regulatory protein